MYIFYSSEILLKAFGGLPFFMEYSRRSSSRGRDNPWREQELGESTPFVHYGSKNDNVS